MIDKFDVEIKRTKRIKSASLEVLPGGKVQVIVPEDFSKLEIDTLLKKKTNWIIEKQREVKDIPPPRIREFVSGESFPLLGRELRLRVEKGHIGPIRESEGLLIAKVPEGTSKEEQERLVREQVVDLYKQLAEEKLKERVEYFAKKLVVAPKRVVVQDFEKRWGSCHQDGTVCFNWQVIAAPSRVVDYVVVHELCHLVVPDHSSKFWRQVQNIIPEYKADREQLKHLYKII